MTTLTIEKLIEEKVSEFSENFQPYWELPEVSPKTPEWRVAEETRRRHNNALYIQEHTTKWLHHAFRAIATAAREEEKEFVNMSEVWVPCERGEGQAISKDGKRYLLAAVLANGKPIHLSDDVVLENIPKTPKEIKALTPHHEE